MKTARHLLAPVLLALALTGPASADDKTVPESDFNAYKELAQVKLDAAKESLQKDVAALGTRVDNQDKRIDQQGNRIGDVSISLTWFGILLTLLAIIAGFVGYYTASTKARKEAQDEARKAVDDWLKTHEADLKQRIKAAEDFAADSRTHIQTFEDEINQLKAQLSDKLIAHTNRTMAETNALAEDAKRQLQAAIAQSAGQTTPPASPEALEALQAQAENLRHKAEAEYSFNDWNDRAFAALGDSKFEDAAQYWQRVLEAPDAPPHIAAWALNNKGAALERLGHLDEAVAAFDLVEARHAHDTALREPVLTALVNKGVALQRLGRTAEAIAALDLIEARYATDTTLRVPVGQARNDVGFMLLCRAKADWAIRDRRQADLDLAARLFEQAEADVDDKPIVLGNRAYCAHLRGEPVEVVRPQLERALKDGGERLYKGALDDLAIHPVPEDATYRALLDEVWGKLRGEDPPEAAPVAG
jgi:tetratricopeptide (TPR) repeat protein